MAGEREIKVQHCMAIMRELRWVKGKTSEVLAREWGMAVNSVEHISAEAWRRVKAEVMDPDSASATIGTYLTATIAKAMRGEESTKDGIAASKVLAEVVGAKAAEKHEVTMTGAPTPTDARRVVARLFGDVAPSVEDDKTNEGNTDGTDQSP